MLDIITAVYAFMGGVGLVGADAYMNSSTIHLETMVAPAYVQEGFGPRLVEALFLAELEDIIDAKSIVNSPHMVSSKDEPMSVAIAEAVGLSHALDAAKSAVGAKHPFLIVSVLSEGKDGKSKPRIVVAGETSHGRNISISTPINNRPLDEALKDAAFQAMKEIDPYVTALHVFEVAEANNRQPVEAVDLLKEALGRENRDTVNPQRSRLENLMGLTELLLNNPQEAKIWFGKSMKSDNSSSVAALNFAFVAAVDNDCESAITLVKPLLDPTYLVLAPDEELAYPARNLLGVCSSRLDKFEDAENYFAEAADGNPGGTAVYYYWAHSLAKQGRSQEAEEMMRIAQLNISHMDNVPEIAMLYFWINDDGKSRFQKRMNVLPSLTSKETHPT